MKGLLYRQFYLNKKNLLIGSALMLVIFFYMYLVIMSAKFGNISKLDNAEEQLKNIYTQIMIYSSFFPALALSSDTVISSDIKSRWNIFSYTLPVSAKDDALARTIYLVILFLSSMIINVINILGISAVAGIRPNFSFLMTGFCVTVFFLFPLIFRNCALLFFKNKNTADMIFSLLFMIIMTAVMVSFAIYIKKNPEFDLSDLEYIYSLTDKLKEKYLWVIIVLCPCSFVMNFFGTMYALKRRCV